MDHIIYTSGVVHERFPAILIATTTYLNISYENSKQQNRYLWVRKTYLEVWAVPEQSLNFWLTSPTDGDTQLLYRCAALLNQSVVANALGPNFTISQYKLGFRWFNSRFTVHGSQVQYSLTLSRQLNYIIQYNVKTNDLSTMVSCI